jgi:hypothetical protein
VIFVKNANAAPSVPTRLRSLLSILLRANPHDARISAMKRATRTFPQQRHSASAAQALHAEIEQVKKMTILERVELCLSLRSKYPCLPLDAINEKPHAKGK